MNDEDRNPEEGSERPRPRVVDKRVSSRSSDPSAAAPPPVEAPPAEAPPAVETGSAPEPATAPPTTPPAGGEQVWTPEQEAEAQALLEEMAGRPALDWIVNSAVTLVNVAAAKLDTQQFAEAQVTIDALEGLLKTIGPKLGNVEQPLRQTLAQLQMAYAQAVAGPGTNPPGATPPGIQTP